MEDKQIYYVELISRYLSGEASSQEITKLSLWLKEQEENRLLFHQYRKTWEAVDQKVIEDSIDVAKAFEQLQKKINEKKTLGSDKGIVSMMRPLYRYAAILIFVFISSFMAYQLFFKTDMIQVVADNHTIEQSLKDGSVITLNKGAQLSYPDEFEEDKRSVKFEGEGYFKVAHNETKPFVVEAGEVCVEVLGTEFYVNTDTEDGEVEVVLSSGKVAVYFKDRQEGRTILQPGDRVEISPEDNRVEKSEVVNENYKAFKTRKLVFDNESMEVIAKVLESTYHENIELDAKIKNCRVTTSFDNQSFESIMMVLQATLDLQVDSTSLNDQVRISGTGCE